MVTIHVLPELKSRWGIDFHIDTTGKRILRAVRENATIGFAVIPEGAGERVALDALCVHPQFRRGAKIASTESEENAVSESSVSSRCFI